MKKVQAIYISLAATTLAVVAGCASSHFHSTRKPADAKFEATNGSYDKLHPLYAIECASSKFDQKNEKPGGPYGHTFMYLKGACRDRSAPPNIKICDEGTDLTNPESGVGLALDKTFGNTRYVPIDGFNFLITGALSPDAPLDNVAFEAAIQKFKNDGYADGIVLQPKDEADKKNPNVNKGDPNMSDAEWIANEVIGSSFAVDFARNLGCVAVPINQEMLQAAVTFVNKQNHVKFHWNPVSDQCVQFAHNVFAAMGIGKPITVSSGHNFLVKWSLDAFDFTTFVIPFVRSRMPAPTNELDKTDQETNGARIYTVREAYNDKTVRENFGKFKRIIATDGVLIWTHDAHKTDNDYFNVGNQLVPVDFPIIKPIEHTFRKLTEMASTTLISDNLVTYQKRLQDVISSMDVEGRGIDSPEYCDFAAVQNKTPNSTDFKSFCKDYTAYLLQAKSDAQSNADKLTALSQQ